MTTVKALPASQISTGESTAGAKGGVAVEVDVPDSLRSQVLFVHASFPRAHLVLGRGDAEEDEADIPFTRSDVNGQLRLRSSGACHTTWILTVLHR